MALKRGTMRRVSGKLVISVGLLWLAVLMLKWGFGESCCRLQILCRGHGANPGGFFPKPWCVWGWKPGGGRMFQRPFGFCEVP